jgi:hypothetical protein
VSQAAPFVWVVVGAPGTGKSSLIRIAMTTQQPRVMLFDPMREFGDFGQIPASLNALRKALADAGAGSFALVYRPDTSDPQKLKERFGVFCKLAFAAGDVLVVVDEAADVTSPNRYEVPEGWSTLLRQGRHRSVRILAATQRPADIDKRLWTFATRIRTGRLNYGSDRAELANVLNVRPDDIAGLIERQWIERDMLTGATARGSIEWVKGRPQNVPAQPPASPKPPDSAKADPVRRIQASNGPRGRPDTRAAKNKSRKA